MACHDCFSTSRKILWFPYLLILCVCFNNPYSQWVDKFYDERKIHDHKIKMTKLRQHALAHSLLKSDDTVLKFFFVPYKLGIIGMPNPIINVDQLRQQRLLWTSETLAN